MVDEIFFKNNVPTKLNKLYKKRIRDFFYENALYKFTFDIDM